MSALTKDTLDWLGRRCNHYCSDARKPPRREIERLQSAFAMATPSTGEESLEVVLSREKYVIEALFKIIQLVPPHWRAETAPDSLPAVVRLPGMGWGILYAKTEPEGWLLDTPSGRRRINLLPEDAEIASLVAANNGNQGRISAFELFRSTLLARKNLFLQAASGSLLANLLALGSSLYSMQVYDRVIPTQGVSTLVVLTTGVCISMILEMVVKMARSAILEHSIKGMDLELSHAIYARLLGIRMDQFPASIGSLSGQIRSYETIRSFASAATLFMAVDAPFALLFLLVIAAIAGFHVALVPAIFFFLAISVGLYYRRNINEHAKTLTAASNRKLGLLVETIENAESIKAQGAGWQQLARWDAVNRQAINDDIKIRHYSEQSAYFAAFIQQISYALLVAAGAWEASTTTNLTMGGLIACSILSGRVLAPVATLPGLVVQWAHARAALEGLEKVFDLQSDNHDIERPLTPEIIYGEFQLSEMRFTYRGRPDTLAVERLHIRAGEKVAILGQVGAGKSTLLKLLAGLYHCQKGKIHLDGLDIQQIARSHLSERLGYFPQEVKLLSGTLRENLVTGLSGIEDEDVLKTCQATGLSALIAAHPKGLDMPIAEGGTGVSGGQRQLIALTRLLLSKPDIWLLDEPTAAMDEHIEQHSLQTLRQAIKTDQTLILVTHKPVLLGLVDRIIILVPGGIAMDGPRDAVLEKLRQGNNQPTQPPNPPNPPNAPPTVREVRIIGGPQPGAPA